MAEFHYDPRTRRETDPEIPEIQKMINYDFDFDGVVGAVFNLLEKKTTFRGCRLSVVGRDLKKRPLVESDAMPRKGKSSRHPLLSYPLPLTNDEVRYTLDVYAFETPSISRAWTSPTRRRDSLAVPSTSMVTPPTSTAA